MGVGCVVFDCVFWDCVVIVFVGLVEVCCVCVWDGVF